MFYNSKVLTDRVAATVHQVAIHRKVERRQPESDIE